MAPNKKTEERYEVRGDELLAKVKEIIKEGNARRMIIKNKEGQTLVEVPLTVGVIGVAAAPIMAAVGAIAALVTECSIIVEKRE